MKNMSWYVYIARCGDDSLYTGITTDLQRREKEHNTHDVLGAKSLRGKRPVVIIHQEQWETRSEATKREAAIKRMNRTQKLQFLGTVPPIRSIGSSISNDCQVSS